jgi:uncharacterized membrane protein YeaQ/YmgE (transglycosylase-associated protein family)
MLFLFVSFLLVAVSPAAEGLMAALLGVVGTYVTQFIKTRLSWSGQKAMTLTIGVSTVLGFIVAVATGEWNSKEIVNSAAIVFSLATLAYRYLVAKDS